MPEFAGTDLGDLTTSAAEPSALVADELLRDLDGLVDRLHRAVEAIPGYAAFDWDWLHAFYAFAAPIVIDLAFRKQEPAGQEQFEQQAPAIRRRIEAGLPLAEAIRTSEVVFAQTWVAAVEAAARIGVPFDALVAPAALLMQYAAAAARNTVTIYAEVEQQAARADERRRAQFVLDALHGRLDPERIASGAHSFGLPPVAEWHPFRATANAEHAAMASRSVIAELDGAIVGIAPHDRIELPAGAVLALGGPAPLTDLAPSFAVASRVFHAAHRFGLEGVITLLDVRLRTAIADDDVVGRALVDRYLAPLARHGSRATPLVETMAAYLANGLRNETTARVLNIHHNTLRYRLERFAHLTGADIHDFATLAEIWWALEYAGIATAGVR